MNKAASVLAALAAASAAVACDLDFLQSSPLPAGMTAFFQSSACPEGWQPVEGSRGRLILGTADPEKVGKIAGEPMSDQEDRAHIHGYRASLTLKERSISGSNGPNHGGAHKGTYRTPADGKVSAAHGGTPLMQLPFCEPVSGTGATAEAGTWPYLTVAFFRSTRCPEPWVPYDKANGRFIVPITNNNLVGREVGVPLKGLSPPGHEHRFSKTLTLPEQRYGLVAGCCNKNLGKREDNGKHELEGASSETTTNLPTLALNACILRKEDVERPALPDGFSIFSGTKFCPREDGWHEALGTKGRYLISLPEHGDAGVAFGGQPLGNNEMRTHTHGVSGSVTLADHGIAGASGCAWFICARDYVQAGTYSFDGATSAAAIPLPYVPLRQCVRRSGSSS